MKHVLKHALLLAVSLFALQAQAVIAVRDDGGKTIVLQKPAQRIVSLAPHATELIFAAGGGDRIVGTVSYSDYPAAALKIPRVGDYQQIDIERIVALKPDLLVAWPYGGSERQLQQLQQLGIPVFRSEPKMLADIPDSVLRLGKLMGTEIQAEKTAAAERAQLARLEARHRNRPPVRTFYQVWGRPIYTLNGSDILSDVIRLCGGENVFAKLSATAPMVSVEAVLLANPEVMMTGDRQAQKSSGLDIWRQYPDLLAVKNGNLFSIDADLLNRAGPRLIDGAAVVCEKLELARSRRGTKP